MIRSREKFPLVCNLYFPKCSCLITSPLHISDVAVIINKLYQGDGHRNNMLAGTMERHNIIPYIMKRNILHLHGMPF